MGSGQRTRIINDFLGSLQIFSSAMGELMERQLRTELEEELTVSQFKLLKMVANTAAEKISEVANFLGISNPAASKSVDRLVRRGLLNRREDPKDRRSIQLSLTERGTKLLERCEIVQNETLEKLFKDFASEEFIKTASILDRLSIDLADSSGGTGEICFRCGIFFRDRCLVKEQNEEACYYHLHKRPGRSPRREEEQGIT